MARVPTIEPGQTASPSIGGLPQFNVQASPAAFGGAVGQAEQRTGAQFQGATGDIAGALMRTQELNNENWARDQMTATTAKLSQAGSQYFALKGQAAVNAYPGFLGTVQDTVKDALDGAGSPQSRKMLADAMARVQSYYLESAGRHSAEQTQFAAKQSATSSAENHINSAVLFRNDPSKVDDFINAGVGDIHAAGEIDGADAQTVQANAAAYRGKAYRTVVASVAQENPLAAQALLQRVGPTMDGPSFLAAQEYLKPKVDKANDTAWLSGQVGTAPPIGTNTDINTIWTGLKLAEHGVDGGGVPLTSPKGALGISQIMPGTAEAMSKALGIPYQPDKLMSPDQSYNESLGKAYLGQMLQRYQNPTLAIAAYNAGPGRVDDWLKSVGDPRTGAISTQDFINQIPIKETQDYVKKITNVVGANTGNATAVTHYDPAALRQAAIASSPDIQTQMRRLSMAEEWMHGAEAGLSQKRSDLNARITRDVEPALLNGQDAAIPEQEIRAYARSPDEADRTINNLNVSKTAGTLFKSVALATPEEMQNVVTALTTDQGLNSALLKGKTINGPGGVMLDISGADTATRLKIASRLGELIQQRTQQLGQDPALYALRDPTVAGAQQTMNAGASGGPPDPHAFENYARATLDAQSRLGVPESKRAILTQGGVQSVSDKLNLGDPATADPSPIISGLEKQYGHYWPQVFGQLVKKGVPEVAEAVGVMDTDAQANARQDLVRAYQFAGKKGAKAFDDNSKADRQSITDGLSSTMEPLRQTMLAPGLATAQNNRSFDTMTKAVDLLANYYVREGTKGPAALQKAYDGVIGAKYDFEGTMRVPKGMLPLAEQATGQIEQSLTADDLAPVQSRPGDAQGDLTDAQRRGIMASAPKMWVPNGDDTGLVATAKLPNGDNQPVFHANGKRVEILFDDMRGLTAGQPMPSPPLAMGGL